MRISDWSSGVCSSDLNVAQGREHEAFRWFQEILAPAVFARGVRRARRMKLLDLQLQPENPLPHRYLSLFDFDSDRAERKSVVSGKSVSVSEDLGGRRIIKKKIHY